MKSIIICEGQDDLWFLAYYLHKKMNWNMDAHIKVSWTNYQFDKNKFQVQYMISKDQKNVLAIVASRGQDAIANVIRIVRELFNERFPQDPISKMVIMRDCDDRNQDDIVQSMEAYFDNKVILKNREVCILNENDVELKILPLVIPFDEQGAIETLLMKSIEDSGKEGSYVVSHAKKYIEEALNNVQPVYLQKNREITKAKYSASLAITNPTGSRDSFQELMMSCPWENSASIENHMLGLSNFLKENSQ